MVHYYQVVDNLKWVVSFAIESGRKMTIRVRFEASSKIQDKGGCFGCFFYFMFFKGIQNVLMESNELNLGYWLTHHQYIYIPGCEIG